MAEIRFVHTADLHLDWPFAAFGYDEAGGRMRREEQRQTLAAIVEKGRQAGAHLLLIAGDLFEQRYLSRVTVQFANDLFQAAAPMRIFLLPGRHDPVTATSYYRLYPWAPNVHVFGPRWERVDLDDLGASVYGMGWEEEGPPLSIADLPPVHDPSRINVVLLHGAPADADFARLGADYVALGGWHQPVSPLGPDGRPAAHGPGTPEPLTWEEQGERSVVVGVVDKAGARLQVEPVDSRQAVEERLDVTGARTEQEIIRALLDVESPARRQRDLYRITLTGAIDPYLVLDLPAITEQLATDFHLLRLVDQTTPDYEYARLSGERNARGHFLTQMLALQEAAVDPDSADRVRRALILGLRALERGTGG